MFATETLHLWSQFSEKRRKALSEPLLLGLSTVGSCTRDSLADGNTASPLLHVLLRRAQHQVFSYLLSFCTFGLPWLISSRKGGGLSLSEEPIWWLQGSTGMWEFWSQALWGWWYKPDFLLPGWGDYGIMHKVSMGTFLFIQAWGNTGHNVASLSTKMHLRLWSPVSQGCQIQAREKYSWLLFLQCLL